MRQIALFLSIALSGCGYKAPLYLPGVPRDQPPVLTPAPAPDRPQPPQAVPPPQ